MGVYDLPTTETTMHRYIQVGFVLSWLHPCVGCLCTVLTVAIVFVCVSLPDLW